MQFQIARLQFSPRRTQKSRCRPSLLGALGILCGEDFVSLPLRSGIRRFWVWPFVLANVLIDIEVPYFLALGE